MHRGCGHDPTEGEMSLDGIRCVYIYMCIYIVCLIVCPLLVLSFVQEPLPGPRDPIDVDWTLADAELFTRYFCPIEPSVTFLGDLWMDVTCLHLIISVAMQMHPQVYHHIDLCSHEAKLPAALRYLAGCRHFQPQGRWARDLIIFPWVSFQCVTVVISRWLRPTFLRNLT